MNAKEAREITDKFSIGIEAVKNQIKTAASMGFSQTFCKINEEEIDTLKEDGFEISWSEANKENIIKW